MSSDAIDMNTFETLITAGSQSIKPGQTKQQMDRLAFDDDFMGINLDIRPGKHTPNTDINRLNNSNMLPTYDGASRGDFTPADACTRLISPSHQSCTSCYAKSIASPMELNKGHSLHEELGSDRGLQQHKPLPPSQEHSKSSQVFQSSSRQQSLTASHIDISMPSTANGLTQLSLWPPEMSQTRSQDEATLAVTLTRKSCRLVSELTKIYELSILLDERRQDHDLEGILEDLRYKFSIPNTR